MTGDQAEFWRSQRKFDLTQACTCKGSMSKPILIAINNSVYEYIENIVVIAVTW